MSSDGWADDDVGGHSRRYWCGNGWEARWRFCFFFFLVQKRQPLVFFSFSRLFSCYRFLVASSAFLSVTFMYAFFWVFFLIFSSSPLLSCPSPPLFRSPIPCSVIFLSCVSFPSLSLSLFPSSLFFYLSFSAPPVLSVFLSFPFCLQSLPFCLVFHPFLSRPFSGFIARECIDFPRMLLLK